MGILHAPVGVACGQNNTRHPFRDVCIDPGTFGPLRQEDCVPPHPLLRNDPAVLSTTLPGGAKTRDQSGAKGS